MAGHNRSVKLESRRGIVELERKERVFHIVRVEQLLVVINDIRDIHENLIESKPLHLPTPSESFKKSVKSLRGISKPS